MKFELKSPYRQKCKGFFYFLLIFRINIFILSYSISTKMSIQKGIQRISLQTCKQKNNMLKSH